MRRKSVLKASSSMLASMMRFLVTMPCFIRWHSRHLSFFIPSELSLSLVRFR